MRLLKKKIEKARKHFQSDVNEQDTNYSHSIQKNKKLISQAVEIKSMKQRNRVSGAPKMKYSNRCLKNVAKNYGRAICNFIASDVSDTYLFSESLKLDVNIERFRSYINEKKNKLDGIDQFRDMLLPKEEDPKELKNFKLLFQKLGAIFIKYFSVNWICSGRLNYKIEYIKVRYKVLRRVQNPELFTYLR